jgi:hypothetical protein
MKVKINNYTSSQFSKVIGKSNLFFDTKNGLLYYKENNKLQELGMSMEEFEQLQQPKYLKCYETMRGVIPTNIYGKNDNFSLED